MSDIQLYLFGSFRAIQSDTTELTFHGRKAAALLAFLASEPSLHSRDSLMGLFWTDLPEKAARNNLRVALARLSKGLGQKGLGQEAIPYVLTDRHTVKLNPDAKLWLDTSAFSELIEQTQNHKHDSRNSCLDCHEKLLTAAEYYRAEFLHGFYLEGCSVFEEWQHMQREHYHLEALELLTDISNYLEQQGDFAKAERYAKWQLKLEPLREDAHSSLMRLLAFQGQHSAALVQFETCKQVLDAELELAPDHETQALYEKIKAGEFKSETQASALAQESLNQESLKL